MKKPDLIAEVCAVGFSVGRLKIVDEITFSAAPGQIVALFGPNGAGKTTVIDLISGFLRPESGSIKFWGEEVSRMGADARSRRGIARTFQASPAIPNLSILEHMRLAHDWASPRSNREDADADAILKHVALAQFTHLLGRDLSSTQRKLLDLARALATAPDLLLLDEPFAGLGKAECELLLAEIRRARARGTAIIIVEHRLALLRGLVDSAIAMHLGRIVCVGPLDDVLQNPEVQRAFVGPHLTGGTKA